MYTLKEILNMPYKEERKFRIVGQENSSLYVDENGVLRFEADERDIEMYGDNTVVVTNELLDYKFEIIKQYISFQMAFNEWINENSTICCDNIKGITECYDGDASENDKMNTYLFYPIDIAKGKWYINNEDFNKKDNKIEK